MSFFAKLFGKKKKAEKAEVAPAPVAEEVKAQEPPAQETAEPEKAAETVPAPAAKEEAPTPEKAEEPTPAAEEKAEAPAPEKPAKTAPKTDKNPAGKAPAKAPAKAPSKVAISAKSNIGTPFFKATPEDIRKAFAEANEEADAQIAANPGKAVGKYDFILEVDGYHFCLLANNGQILFESPSFTTLIGALSGVKTFKKTVEEGEFEIKSDKYKRYRFVLARKYYGENYTTKDQCTKCAESVKNFANCAKVVLYNPTEEEVAAFEAAKNAKRTVGDVNWDEVAANEAAAQKMGKFEICREEGSQCCFFLLANNGQILYSGRSFQNEAACRRGIESFKRAAYVGNFFVDRDKFNHYRYVLKNIGSAPSFIGESYENKSQCEKVIESVKKFIVTATVELEEVEEA